MLKRKRPNYGIDSIEMISIPIKGGQLIEGYAIYYPQKLKALLEHKKTEKFYYSPFRSLHDTIKIFFSDFLFFNTKAEQNLHEPWLLFKDKFGIEWLKLIIQSWYDVQFQQSLEETVLDELCFLKEERMLDYLVSESGNPQMKDKAAYTYFPKYCISKLQNPLYIDHLNKSLKFVPIYADKAEMVSWPPEKYEKNKKIDYFSYKVTLCLHTIPFHREPQLFIHVGLIRWVMREKVVTREKHLTTYIRGKWPWIVGSEEERPFIATKIKRHGHSYEWKYHVDKIINKVNPASQISSLHYLNEDPSAIFEGTNQFSTLSVSVPYSSHLFSKHRINSGAGLVESYDIARAVAKELNMNEDFARLPKVAESKTIYTKKIGLRFPKKLQLYLFYSDDNWLETALNAICTCIGVERSDTNQYVVNDSTIQLISIEITENLADFNGNKADVARVVEKLLPNQSSLSGCLFELANKENFKNNIDPKNIIRNVFASNQILTQFITPINAGENNKERFENGVLDLLRQFGILSRRATGLIQLETAYVGFYNIKRNKNSNKSKGEIPIMVKVSNSSVKMCIPSEGWIPYAEGQLLLAKNFDKYSRLRKHTKQFLYANLEPLKDEYAHIILFTHSQNSRQLIPSLNNELIRVNQFEINTAQLSVVRLRNNENFETPDWCAYSSTDGEFPQGAYPQSVPTGLFQLSDYVFFSISKKPGTAKKMDAKKTKLEKPTMLFRRETALEITVAVCNKKIKPLELAKITHDLRNNTSIQYRDEMTLLPLPLHLAEKAKEYAFSI